MKDVFPWLCILECFFEALLNLIKPFIDFLNDIINLAITAIKAIIDLLNEIPGFDLEEIIRSFLALLVLPLIEDTLCIDFGELFDCPLS